MSVLDFFGRQQGQFYIPEIRVIGTPEAIRFFLSQEGLNSESIDKLMKTAINLE